ncbi:phage-associated protein [Escherichia coli]|uniref:Phage-associated protein n=1 Tax=Escherichia coli TaxID=562 RepID=A0A376RM54_ECOLX|nr:phage-associated protein [Escherichia coli]
MRLASRFGYTNQIRRDRPLTHEETDALCSQYFR